MNAHGPAHIPGEPICKVCHRAHDLRWNPRHMFEPMVAEEQAKAPPSPPAASAVRLETPEEMAERLCPAGNKWADSLKAEIAAAIRADICSLLTGLRAVHSAAGVLDAEGFAADVAGLVARMGREEA